MTVSSMRKLWKWKWLRILVGEVGKTDVFQRQLTELAKCSEVVKLAKQVLTNFLSEIRNLVTGKELILNTIDKPSKGTINHHSWRTPGLFLKEAHHSFLPSFFVPWGKLWMPCASWRFFSFAINEERGKKKVSLC